MAALMEGGIERRSSKDRTDFALNDQSEGVQTSPTRAKKLLCGENSNYGKSAAPPDSLSISLGLLSETDLAKKVGSSHALTSPVSDNSLNLNFGSSIVTENRQLDFTPSQSGASNSARSSTDGRATSTDAAWSSAYHSVDYTDIDVGQRMAFEKMLKKESGCARSWLHKGLIVNIGFLIVLIVGVVLGEVFFPLEGVRGRGISLVNDTECNNASAACFAVRIVRAVGVFGFVGGITNWIAIEMLFRSIPFLVGTGVFAKQYKVIRESIKHMVVNTLFEPSALKQYFTGKKKHLRDLFQLENHFGGLLESDATNKIIDGKIDSILARPEGFILAMMGIDHSLLKDKLKRHIQSFITELAPNILDKISSSGLADGVGVQAEVAKILEERTEELTSMKVRQLMSLMIRKHLNWLIIWGNILGALAGLLAEVVAIVVARYTET